MAIDALSRLAPVGSHAASSGHHRARRRSSARSQDEAGGAVDLTVTVGKPIICFTEPHTCISKNITLEYCFHQIVTASCTNLTVMASFIQRCDGRCRREGIRRQRGSAARDCRIGDSAAKKACPSRVRWVSRELYYMFYLFYTLCSTCCSALCF